VEPTLQDRSTVVGSRVERDLLAKIGAFAFSVAIALPASLSAAATPTAVMVATALEVTADPASATGASLEIPELRAPRAVVPAAVAYRAVPGAVAGLEAPPITVLPAIAPIATPAPVPPPEPLVLDGVVLASWYGPGFYGNRTACGQTYSEEILGVAHRLLPCGTKIQITSPSGKSLIVPVIDRGPFVAGRSLDLSFATKSAIGCSDLCSVRMVVLR
jgi:rare lipoprotein A